MINNYMRRSIEVEMIFSLLSIGENISSNDRPFIQCKSNNANINCLIDTGADISMFSGIDLFKKIFSGGNIHYKGERAMFSGIDLFKKIFSGGNIHYKGERAMGVFQAVEKHI